MKKGISILTVFIFVFIQSIATAGYFVKADGDTSCLVRVEGFTDTIAKGTASGKSALDIAEKMLQDNNIHFTVSDGGFTEINGIKEGQLSDSAAWSFYVKKQNSVKSGSTSLDTYMPEDGDEIVIYYTDSKVPYLDSLNFLKDDDDQGIKIKFSNKDNGISGALVKIGDINYSTDENGEISIPEGLKDGTYYYKISGYSCSSLSSVVMDQGAFTMEGSNPPVINFTKTDNEIPVEISSLISATAESIKNYADPYAYVSLDKLHMNKNENYISASYNRIINYGISSCSNGELESMIIATAACGYTPYDFAGCSLPAVLYSRSMDSFRTDDIIFGLLAMNYANIQDTYSINRKILVKKLLENELTGENNSGWGLGDSMDPYLSGAALCALSPYYDEPEVKAAVDNAVKSMCSIQHEDGFWEGYQGVTSETSAFAIMGLIAVGVNPEGITILDDGTKVNFAKPKGDLVSAMLSFMNQDGMFRRSMYGLGNTAATEQCLRALICLFQYKNLGNAYNYYESEIDASKLKVYTETEAKLPGIEILKSGETAFAALPVVQKNTGTKNNSSGKTKTENKKSTNRIYISIGGLILIIGVIGIAAQAINRRD